MVKKMTLKVGLFCGARVGLRSEYTQAAVELGHWIGRCGHALVYGGGSVGLMGVAADATLAAGGQVYGVITEKLLGMEVGHAGITEMAVTPTMASRKSQLIDQSDVFVILPGGLGTYDEVFEVLTLKQLGEHQKMTYFVNVRNYFDTFLKMVDHATQEGFLPQDPRSYCRAVSDVRALEKEIAAQLKM